MDEAGFVYPVLLLLAFGLANTSARSVQAWLWPGSPG